MSKKKILETSKSALRPTFTLIHCCMQHVSYNMLHATLEYTWDNFHATCCFYNTELSPKMDDDSVVVGACGVIIALIIKRRRRNGRKKRLLVREWIQNTQHFGAYQHLVQELRLADRSTYRHFLRMDVPTFDQLLSLVGPSITYQDTNMRQAIPPGERLALTLRFLATGK